MLLGAADDASRPLVVRAAGTSLADAAGRWLAVLASSGSSGWSCAAYLQLSAAVLEAHVVLLDELQALTSRLQQAADKALRASAVRCFDARSAWSVVQPGLFATVPPSAPHNRALYRRTDCGHAPRPPTKRLPRP